LSVERQEPETIGIDPESGKERRHLEWFDASLLGDILPDGKAITYLEWGGPAGPLYLHVYRKLDGSAPVALGPGTQPRFSPDGTWVAGALLTRPPQVALNPTGAGESRRLAVGEIATLRMVSWFPDGKHLLLAGAAAGQPLRTWEMDTEGAKPQALGPADFVGALVAPDGKRIAGRNGASEAVVFDRESQKLEVIAGVEPREEFSVWTEDGRSLITYSSTPSSARIYRTDVATGQRTTLQAIDPAEKAGLMTPIRLAYAVRAKTYAYSMIRILGNLYIVEGLE
jgi:Tol biopolymer transport system component